MSNNTYSIILITLKCTKDGMIIERIYEIPEKEIYDIETNKGRGSISIMKYDSNEMYRNKDLGELEN